MSDDNYDFKPGFRGHDSMRNKAMKEFGPEMRSLSLSTPESNSSKARTNMRFYKKGGHVHGLTKMQTDLYIPTRSKQHHQNQVRFEKVCHKADGGMLGTPDVNSRIQQANQLLGAAVDSPMGIKRGGKVHHKHRVHKRFGGNLTPYEMGNQDLIAGRSALGLRRGGKAHHNRVKKDIGGTLMGIGKSMLGIPAVNFLSGRKANGGLIGSGKNQDDSRLMLRGEPLQKGFHGHGLKHGGRAHKLDGGSLLKTIGKATLGPIGHAFNRGGKTCRKSEGGPMRGEMPGMGAKNNYESGMRGEHEARGAMRHGGKSRRAHRADGGPLLGALTGGNLMDAAAREQSSPSAAQNPGGVLRRGGKVHRKSEGGPMRGEHPTHHMSRNNYESNMRGEHCSHRKMNEGGKAFAEGGYAAGGAGKIRHGQMTMSGRQILPRSKFKHS